MTMNNFLAKIYTYRFLGEFLLILPLFAVMLADYGLSVLQISILFVIWSGTSFILEVPSGVLADKYSRKHLLFVAQLCQAACFTLWIFYPTFWAFLIGFILWGIRDAFTSGTFEALVYDELKNAKQENTYAKVSGHAGSVYFIATTLASLAATFAIVFGYSFVLGASAAVALAAGVVALFVPSAPKAKDVEDKKYFALAAEGLSVLKKNPQIIRAITIASVTAMLSMGLFEFWMLIAKQSGVPNQGLGIFLAVIAGGQAVAGFVAHKYENFSARILYGILILGGVLIVALGMYLNIQSLALVVIFNALFTFLIILFNTKLQHVIPSETRATISSVSSFATRVGVFAITLSFGFLAEKFSYGIALEFFGGLIVAVGTVYLLSSFRYGAERA